MEPQPNIFQASNGYRRARWPRHVVSWAMQEGEAGVDAAAAPDPDAAAAGLPASEHSVRQ
jgi:hypothetical protein